MKNVVLFTPNINDQICRNFNVVELCDSLFKLNKKKDGFSFYFVKISQPPTTVQVRLYKGRLRIIQPNCENNLIDLNNMPTLLIIYHFDKNTCFQFNNKTEEFQQGVIKVNQQPLIGLTALSDTNKILHYFLCNEEHNGALCWLNKNFCSLQGNHV